MRQTILREHERIEHLRQPAAAYALPVAQDHGGARFAHHSDEARSYDQLARMKSMEVMHMIDKDNRGYVTREEFLNFQERFFDRMDQDHDGMDGQGPAPAVSDRSARVRPRLLEPVAVQRRTRGSDELAQLGGPLWPQEVAMVLACLRTLWT